MIVTKMKSAVLKSYLAVSMFVASTGVAAAGTFDNVTTMLTDLVGIFTPILDIVIAVIPIMIALAIATFVLGMFTAILGKIKGKM